METRGTDMPRLVKMADSIDPLLAQVVLSASSVLQDRVRRRLRASSYAVLHDIECDCQEGTVTLHGEVTTYFLKQVAQELVRKVRGVERITNRIDVVEAKELRHGRQRSDC